MSENFLTKYSNHFNNYEKGNIPFEKTIEKAIINLECNYNEWIIEKQENFLELNQKLFQISETKEAFIKVYNSFLMDLKTKKNGIYNIVENKKGTLLFQLIKGEEGNSNLENEVFIVFNFLKTNLQEYEYNSKQEEIVESIRFLFHGLHLKSKDFNNKTYDDFLKGWDILPRIGKEFLDLLNIEIKKIEKEILDLEKILKQENILDKNFYYKYLILKTKQEVNETLILDRKNQIQEVYIIFDKYLKIIEELENKKNLEDIEFVTILEKKGFKKEEIFGDLEFIVDFFEENNFSKNEKIELFIVKNFFEFLFENVYKKTFKDFKNIFGGISKRDFIETQKILEEKYK